MDRIQTINKLELLPNEILIECFRYLETVQMFYSFDQLNSRYNRLIRRIPLHLDFRDTPRLICDQFCQKMLSDEEIKNQIFSIRLSNKDTTYGIQSFLSTFQLVDDFPHLQSLTLVRVSKSNVIQLISTLPLLSGLSCFRLIDPQIEKKEIFSILPTCQLHTLMLSTLSKDFQITDQLSSITNLTISECHLRDLFQILRTASELKYLNIHHIQRYSSNRVDTNNHFSNHHAIHLKQLIIKHIEYDFSDFIIILKQTPNLNSLTLGASSDKNLVDACQWEDLISSSLPSLKNFKFRIYYYHGNNKNGLEERFKQFQSDFWCKQHHWYTEYELSNYEALIYTIPYIFSIYALVPHTKGRGNELINNVNIFANVTNLRINPDALRNERQYYFPYVISLSLRCPDLIDTLLLTAKDIQSLKVIVNFSTLQELYIPYTFQLETPSVLLEILKGAPHLSSLCIHLDILQSLFEDDQLCQYLNKMIRKLDIGSFYDKLLDDYDRLTDICQVFSNIEELTCTIYRLDCLLFLIQHFSKLSRISVALGEYHLVSAVPGLEEQTHRLGMKIVADFDVYNSLLLTIHINRNTF
ncbi:unnamed protein product [Didymodactylos carnosus]|uniref:F-box domain-containing protein n=1 Tax=Didymodactylos carnosus TaxID=1234261 RepID=A0A815Z2R1_9BILA|nr:unnamed protein product [Didymodactylos carnosus]CAF4445452.1 unnamed protein product [Didymodactylos carnosus]